MLICAGCGDTGGLEPDPDEGCTVNDTPTLELAQPGGEFGDLQDGGPILFGDGLQTAGSFVPFRMRIDGLNFASRTYLVTISCIDGNLEELGREEVEIGFICANAGPDAWKQVSAGVHLRIANMSPTDLEDELVAFTFSVDDHDGRQANARIDGLLRYDP